MRTFLLNLLLIQIFIKNQIIINDSTFLRKYIGSRKYVAASRKITIVHTIEHLLAHFDLHSNIGWFITRIVSTGCSTIIECNYVSSSFRLAREWNVLLLHLSDNTQFQKLLVILSIMITIKYVEILFGNTSPPSVHPNNIQF